MNSWLFRVSTVALAFAVLAVPASAHEPFVEEEMARRAGSLIADEDFSFAQPFVIEGNIEESRAIFSYLHPGDVDVFTFTLTPGDFLVPGTYPPVFAPVIVSASALPPACVSYNAAYPVSALLGPGLPPPPRARATRRRQGRRTSPPGVRGHPRLLEDGPSTRMPS